MRITIEEAKQRLKLPEIFRRLAVPSESIPERDGHPVRCPWPDRHANGDRKPAFNTHAGGTRFKCFACGIEGDAPDFISAWLGTAKDESCRRFLNMAGAEQESFEPIHRPKPKGLRLPSDLRPPTDAELEKIAASRNLDPVALVPARGWGLLYVGTVHGFPAWIFTDPARKAAEARRIDRLPFPSIGDIGERKAHTIAGSVKNWPVGIAADIQRPEAIRAILLTEGTADPLAAFHFAMQFEKFDVLPVAMLGRNCRQIAPEAMKRFAGKHVRLYPHADTDGGGLKACTDWAHQIRSVGGTTVCDAFDFRGLVRNDGMPVNDLNDCALIVPESTAALTDLLP